MQFPKSLSENFRLVGPPFPPYETYSSGHYFGRYRLVARPALLGVIPVALVLLVFGTLDRF